MGAPRRAAAYDAGRVEVVEAIEAHDGSLHLLVFDEDFTALAHLRGCEAVELTLAQALTTAAAGNVGAWSAAAISQRPQVTAKALTARRAGYTVIGRWTWSHGLCLRELGLAGPVGLAWAGEGAARFFTHHRIPSTPLENRNG